MNIRDKRNLKKIREGNIKVFEEIFHQFYPGMCSYADSLIKQPNVAEEVVQDVFYNIWKNRADLNIINSWQSYLYRSVFNNSMMYLRKAKRELTLNEQWADSQIESDENPSEEMDARELDTALLLALQGLPERTREIFNLSRFEGMKYREIANRLSVSVKTVEANMGKALRALRLSLDEFRKTV
ncbi:MAG: RNA polymerase sigma-70 factor [Bacteroidales bacterium]